MRRNIKNMKRKAQDVYVAAIYKETQIGRSLSSAKIGKESARKFRKIVFRSCKKLRRQVDNGTIKNSTIRGEIERVSKIAGVRVGHSQKIINTYLKGYCLLLNKSRSIIKELDCPLDSTTMDKKQRIKNIATMEVYENWQKQFEKEYGTRILRDMEYDSNRMKKYLQ